MALHHLPTRTAPEQLLNFADHKLQQILSDINGINLVMLCSADGFELLAKQKTTLNNRGKLAAVSSSILAMIQAFMHEIDFVGCQSITLDAENGKAIMTSIPHPQFPMLIVILTTKDILLGQLLYSTKKACEDIANFNV